MKKILYITNMAKQIHHVREVEAKGRIEAKEHFKIDLYNLKQEPEWNESWEQRLKTSDVVIMKHEFMTGKHPLNYRKSHYYTMVLTLVF